MAKFIPQEGNYLTVTLPGEILRAIVLKKINDDTVIVEIATEPLSKLSHSFKFRDIVVCKRQRGLFGEDWVAKQAGGASIETLIEQEKTDAIEKRQKPGNNKLQHKGAKKLKISAKTGGGNSPKRVTKKSKRPSKKG